MVLFSFTFHAKSKEILYCKICRPRINCSWSGSICCFFFSACSLIYHNSHLCHLKRFGLSLAKKLYMKKWSQQKNTYLLLQELYKINLTYVKIYYSRGYIQKIFKLIDMNDGQWMFSNKSIDILRLLYRQN